MGQFQEKCPDILLVKELKCFGVNDASAFTLFVAVCGWFGVSCIT